MTRTVLGVAMAAVAVLALAGPAIAAPDRMGTVNATTPYAWEGAQASGANVDYDSASGVPCDKTPVGYCDVTLVNVDVPADFYDIRGGGLQVSLDNYTPNPGSDFDLYIYESNAAGDRGQLVGSSAGLPGEDETTTIANARGYYLVQVVYFAVTQSGYSGEAKLVTRAKSPPDIDAPPGLQEFLASNPALGFRSRSEPHLARSPTNPNLLIAGSKMYNRDRDSLAEYEFKIGTYVSFDGGRSWSDLGQLNVCPPAEADPTTWPNNRCYPNEDPAKGGTGAEDTNDGAGDTAFDDRGSGDFGEEYITSDVWLDFDDEGNAYAMVLDSPPFASAAGWGMSFHRWQTPSAGDVASGSTWSNRTPINAYDDPVRQQDFLDDKNTFAVNNAGPDGDGNPGAMVACWGQNISTLVKQQTVCERSTDGGRTWPGEPLPISDIQQLVIGVHVVADTRDRATFYAVWLEYAQGLAGLSGTYRFARTTDGGATWEPSLPVATVNDIPRTFPGQGFRNLSLPIVAVGPNSEIYLTYAEYLPAPKPGDVDGMQADIRIVKARDGRARPTPSFSAPKTVNQDGTNADQFQQYVRVTPSGQVNVAYFDRRLDPENFFIDHWLSRSNDGGETFIDVRLSHDSWDPSINPPISGSGEFIGDYQGLVADDCNA
ncbi:MAG: glycoside hydrolase, partial [Actinobacteria bacterium]|nr:glycoside hydrolase [Actinomycetota bacterium]